MLIKKDELENVNPNRTTSKDSGGRRTPRLSVVSPNHAKFDVNLKKKLIDA